MAHGILHPAIKVEGDLQVAFHLAQGVSDHSDSKHQRVASSVNRSVDPCQLGVTREMHARQGCDEKYLLWLESWDAMSIRLNSKNKFKVEITVGGQNVAFRENAGPFVFTHRQDYFVAPDQEWVDGTAVSDDKVRQFVVINPGTGYSVEQLQTGKDEIRAIEIRAIEIRAIEIRAIEIRAIEIQVILPRKGEPLELSRLTPTPSEDDSASQGLSVEETSSMLTDMDHESTMHNGPFEANEADSELDYSNDESLGLASAGDAEIADHADNSDNESIVLNYAGDADHADNADDTDDSNDADDLDAEDADDVDDMEADDAGYVNEAHGVNEVHNAYNVQHAHHIHHALGTDTAYPHRPERNIKLRSSIWSGTFNFLRFAFGKKSNIPKDSVQSRAKTPEIEVAAGGYIQQVFVLDNAPTRWNDEPAHIFRVQIVNKDQFQRVTNIQPTKPELQQVDAEPGPLVFDRTDDTLESPGQLNARGQLNKKVPAPVPYLPRDVPRLNDAGGSVDTKSSPIAGHHASSNTRNGTSENTRSPHAANASAASSSGNGTGAKPGKAAVSRWAGIRRHLYY